MSSKEIKWQDSPAVLPLDETHVFHPNGYSVSWTGWRGYGLVYDQTGRMSLVKPPLKELPDERADDNTSIRE